MLGREAFGLAREAQHLVGLAQLRRQAFEADQRLDA
jgi:hypothetical protein